MYVPLKTEKKIIIKYLNVNCKLFASISVSLKVAIVKCKWLIDWNLIEENLVSNELNWN